MKNDLLLDCQRLTSVTVKVRRLGYIVSIPLLVKEYPVPQRVLKKNIKDWAVDNRIPFRHYSLQLRIRRKRKFVGEITTPGAAGRYLKVTEEMGLVTDSKNVQISKIGKVINALKFEGNPFNLSIGQRFLILRVLIEKDFDTLKTLHEIIDEHAHKAKDETELFREKIIRRLTLKLEKATEMNRLLLVDKLRKSIGSIKGWENGKRYYSENIRAPRLEWLMDLDLLTYWDLRSNTISPSESLSRFFEKNIISKEWLSDVYPYEFGFFLSRYSKKKTQKWKETTKSVKFGLLKSLLDRSMSLFEPISHLGRISANQFFDYAQAILLQENGMMAAVSEIEQSLMDLVSSGEMQIQYIQTVSKADKGYILRT